MQPNILIVDDDHELAQMLTEYLAGEGFDVEVAGDGRRALDAIASRRIDLVILDVMLPELNGFEVLKRMRQSLTLPVIMLTARGGDVDRIVGLELGADDYLPKPFNPRELVARIRAVLRRLQGGDVSAVPQAPVTVGNLVIEPATLTVRIGDREVRVTGTEFRVLELLMRAAGQVQSRNSLTERGLGRRLTPYDRSIDTHVSNLRRKLGLGTAGAPEIRSIRGAGYLLTVPGGDGT
jgi:DNA-binding response OmpR family regulator